jgi:hypothetical protein
MGDIQDQEVRCFQTGRDQWRCCESFIVMLPDPFPLELEPGRVWLRAAVELCLQIR